MIRYLFYAIFFIALIAGIYSYLTPAQRNINPLGFMMNKTGYSAEVTRNRTKFQQVNMAMTNGLIDIHNKIDQLSQIQSRAENMIQDQQQVLKDTGKMASDIILDAQKVGEKGDKDILQLQALALDMQNQQHLLVDRGQDLLTLNDQVTKNREEIAQQVDLSKVLTDNSFNSLLQHNDALKSQSTDLFDKIDVYNQELQDQIDKSNEFLKGLPKRAYSSAVYQQHARQRIESLLDKEREEMQRVADAEQRNRDFINDARQKIEDSKERTEDQIQQTQDLIDQERQKSDDQQAAMRQQIADQQERSQEK